MPANHGFELQDGDLELLNYVFQLRLATIDHLSALSGRSVRALWNRLSRLKKRRYLASVARFMQKHVYGIGPQGVAALIEQGYAPGDLANRRLRHHELKDFGIRHSLFVADIHTRLIKLTRTGPVVLADWQEGSSLWDSVVPQRSEPAIPVRPDAYFIMKDQLRPAGKNIVHVFLEADRSTMAHGRMAAKVAAYLAYYEQGLHTRKYPGMQAFTVATITQTPSRAEELRKALLPLIPRPASRQAYPFIPFSDFKIESLLPVSPSAR